jgi:putative holliday junction resolvase
LGAESLNSKQFDRCPILAIDYGQKVTGLAIFTPGVDPYPLIYGTIVYVNDETLANKVMQIVSDELISTVVLGLPLLTDGQESKMTQVVRKFANILADRLEESGQLYLQDETLSSYEARDRMKNSPRYNFKVDESQIDSIAATIILEDFMDSANLDSYK